MSVQPSALTLDDQLEAFSPEEIAETKEAVDVLAKIGDPASPLDAAMQATNDFVRSKMKEDGFYRKIIAPLEIEDSDLLDRSVPSNGDWFCKVMDK